MIDYLIARPKVTQGLASIGLVLLMVSAGMVLNNTVPKAQAGACTAFIPAGKSYTTNWKVSSWLGYDGAVIGPSGWLVNGAVKSGAATNCFVEDWKLQKVIENSTGNNRGRIINRADIDPSLPNETAAAFKLRFLVPEFGTSGNLVNCQILRPVDPNCLQLEPAYTIQFAMPVSEKTWTACGNGEPVVRWDGTQCVTTNTNTGGNRTVPTYSYNRDLTLPFANANNPARPGLYGIMAQGTGWSMQPIEWQVTGTF